MIRLLAWPLGTAAALVTAAAVVLNPVTPVLPDITVPALFPHDNGRSPSVAAPSAAGAATVVPIVAAPALPTPSGVFSPAPAMTPAYVSAPTASAAPPALPVVELPLFPGQLGPSAPTTVPVFRVESPLTSAHTGDRPLPVSRPQLIQPIGPKPMPAAAVGAPETPGSDGGVARSPGRVGPAPDVAPRAHRGPAEPN